MSFTRETAVVIISANAAPTASLHPFRPVLVPDYHHFILICCILSKAFISKSEAFKKQNGSSTSLTQGLPPRTFAVRSLVANCMVLATPALITRLGADGTDCLLLQGSKIPFCYVCIATYDDGFSVQTDVPRINLRPITFSQAELSALWFLEISHPMAIK